MKNKLIKGMIACVVVAVLGYGGYYIYNRYFTTKTVASTTKYYAVSVSKMNLTQTVQGTGSAYSALVKDVTVKNNGTLESLNVAVGDTVVAGQTLFVANSDELTKSVTTAKNNYSKQKLTLASDEAATMVDANKVAQDKINVSDAYTQLVAAKKQVADMTVTAPIGGVVTAVNNTVGDSVSSGKAVLTIVDMSAMKVKISIDELDIEKVQVGQTANIAFDALTDQKYEGTVESISLVGTSSNSVTNYDVIVSIKDPTRIRLGMNATVTVTVTSKDNVLVIPAEALVEANGKKFVMVEDATSSQTNTPAAETPSQGANVQTPVNGGNVQSASQNANTSKTKRNTSTVSAATAGKLVPITTGLETENYIEVTEGVTEGEKLLVTLPSTSSTTTTTTRTGSTNSSFGGLNDFGGGQMPQMPSGSVGGK